MRVLVVTPPPPAVEWAAAKKHLKLSSDAEQTYVEGLIAAATAMLDGPDGAMGRAIGPQTLELRGSARSMGREVRLPFGPVSKLVSVSYLTAADESVEAETSDFELLGDYLAPKGAAFAWTSCSDHREAVRIRYEAGYADGIPAPISTAILLMVGDLYRNRETISAVEMHKVPMSAPVEQLLQPFKVYR